MVFNNDEVSSAVHIEKNLYSRYCIGLRQSSYIAIVQDHFEFSAVVPFSLVQGGLKGTAAENSK